MAEHHVQPVSLTWQWFLADQSLHLQVVRRMYQFRFKDCLHSDLSLQQIRGKEGVRIRAAYQRLASEYGVSWSGRNYKRKNWGEADPINRALSAANAALYEIVLAGLHSLGYSPALGFIHTGKQLSFVYDVADLFKTSTSFPAAFEAAASGDEKIESRARRILRDRCCHERLQDRITKHVPALFSSKADNSEPTAADEITSLWDPKGIVQGGIQHGHHDY